MTAVTILSIVLPCHSRLTFKNILQYIIVTNNLIAPIDSLWVNRSLYFPHYDCCNNIVLSLLVKGLVPLPQIFKRKLFARITVRQIIHLLQIVGCCGWSCMSATTRCYNSLYIIRLLLFMVRSAASWESFKWELFSHYDYTVAMPVGPSACNSSTLILCDSRPSKP